MMADMGKGGQKLEGLVQLEIDLDSGLEGIFRDVGKQLLDIGLCLRQEPIRLHCRER